MQDRSPRRASTLRRISLLAASVGLAAVGWFLLGESESRSVAQVPPRPVLAQIDGIDVTEDEVNALAAEALAELDRTRHQLIFETTRGEVRRRLLEAEAERRGITREELLDLEVARPASATGRDAGELYGALIARLEQSYGVRYLIAPVPAGAGGPAAADDRPAIARLAAP